MIPAMTYQNHAAIRRGESLVKCMRKRIYWSEDAANQAAKKFYKKHRWNQEPYLCPHCHLYHLTTVKER